MNENRINLVAGLMGLVAFAGTGAYMHLTHDHLHGMADGPRLMYRSAHIYVLWAALLNIAVGTASFSNSASHFPRMNMATSLMLAAVPALIFCSFFMESTETSFYRPFTRAAIYLAAFGVIMQAVLAYFSHELNAKTATK